MYDTKLELVFKLDYKIIKLFLVEPENELNLASIVKELRMSKMTIYRSLEKLVKIGILKSHSDNYRRFYKLVESPLIPVLKILANVDSPIINEVLRKFKLNSYLIILYGSRANGTDRKDSDWDLLVVSDELDVVTINKNVSDIESKYDCQVNVKLYTTSEYNEIKNENAPFYREVMSNKFLLKGDLNET